jgi:hypothetical protein
MGHTSAARPPRPPPRPRLILSREITFWPSNIKRGGGLGGLKTVHALGLMGPAFTPKLLDACLCFAERFRHSCCEQRLRTGCSAQAGADSTAPTARSLVAPTSTRLACVCAAVRRAAGLPGLRACSRQRGQQMAAALALRAAHGHSATGSEGGVHGSARRLAGMLATAR